MSALSRVAIVARSQTAGRFERCVELARELDATHRTVPGRVEQRELATIARAALDTATAPRR